MSGPVRQDDPSLPAPWQALYDPASQARYYWNPVTNITTYDRPAGAGPPSMASTMASGPKVRPAVALPRSILKLIAVLPFLR